MLGDSCTMRIILAVCLGTLGLKWLDAFLLCGVVGTVAGWMLN